MEEERAGWFCEGGVYRLGWEKGGEEKRREEKRGDGMVSFMRRAGWKQRMCGERKKERKAVNGLEEKDGKEGMYGLIRLKLLSPNRYSWFLPF